MSRIRLNQEYRNKVANRMRVHLEQEDTQEKEKFFQCRENFKAIQDKTWELAKVCVERQYPKADVDMAHYLQDKYPNVNTIAKDSCFHFGYMAKKEGNYDAENHYGRTHQEEDDKYISKHFDFKLNGDMDGVDRQEDEGNYQPESSDFAYAYFRDELKGRDNCNPDINIEQKWGKGEGTENLSNPHWTKCEQANEKYLGLNNDDHSYAREWNNDYQLDLIGREYCRDRSIGCQKEEFDQLMIWQVAKHKLIQCHTKWIETVLEQLKVLKGGLRDHVYLEQSIDMAKKMGLTISETDILATTSKGIVVSNPDILNHLASLKNKTQTRDQKIALRKIYDQAQK